MKEELINILLEIRETLNKKGIPIENWVCKVPLSKFKDCYDSGIKRLMGFDIVYIKQ